MSKMSELDAGMDPEALKKLIIENLDRESKRINQLILLTRTGDERESLTNAHILLRASINDLRKYPGQESKPSNRGQRLYEMYMVVQLRENLCDTDPWVLLSEDDQHAWETLAKEL